MKNLDIEESLAEKICKNTSYTFPNTNIIYDLLKSLNLELHLISDEYLHDYEYPFELISLKDNKRFVCHIKLIDGSADLWRRNFKDIDDFSNVFFEIDYFYLDSPFINFYFFEDPYFNCKSLEEAMIKLDLNNNDKNLKI